MLREFRQALSAYTLADMMANRYKYFRWTPRTGWLTFVYVVAIPSVIAFQGWRLDVCLPIPCHLTVSGCELSMDVPQELWETEWLADDVLGKGQI